MVARHNEQHPVSKQTKQWVLSSQHTERALLCLLMQRLEELDPDAIVGHNVSGFDLDVLLTRLKDHKVAKWHVLGRLKRSQFPIGIGKVRLHSWLSRSSLVTSPFPSQSH